MRTDFKKKLLIDIALVVGILLIALAIWLIQRSRAKEGAYAIVTVEGNEVARYSLKVDGEWDLNGGTNHLVIRGGEAWLSEANCPDKLCVKQGKVKLGGQTVVCLPNKLTVRIISDDEESVDIVM